MIAQDFDDIVAASFSRFGGVPGVAWRQRSALPTLGGGRYEICSPSFEGKGGRARMAEPNCGIGIPDFMKCREFPWTAHQCLMFGGDSSYVKGDFHLLGRGGRMMTDGEVYEGVPSSPRSDENATLSSVCVRGFGSDTRRSQGGSRSAHDMRNVARSTEQCHLKVDQHRLWMQT